MAQRKQAFRRLEETAEKFTEAIPGIPVVELAGERRVLLENHRGITEYGREQIRVRVRYGQVCIRGCGLIIARMTREQLVICGRIDGIDLLRGRDCT